MKKILFIPAFSIFIWSQIGCKREQPSIPPKPCIQVSADTISVNDSIRVINCNDYNLRVGDYENYHYHIMNPGDTVFLKYQLAKTYEYTYGIDPINASYPIGHFTVVVQ